MALFLGKQKVGSYQWNSKIRWHIREHGPHPAPCCTSSVPFPCTCRQHRSPPAGPLQPPGDNLSGTKPPVDPLDNRPSCHQHLAAIPHVHGSAGRESPSPPVRPLRPVAEATSRSGAPCCAHTAHPRFPTQEGSKMLEGGKGSWENASHREIQELQVLPRCLYRWQLRSLFKLFFEFELQLYLSNNRAQPLPLKLERSYWVRLVYKSSELNIRIRFSGCFSSPEFKQWQLVMQQLLPCTAARTGLLSEGGTAGTLIFPTKLPRFKIPAWLTTSCSVWKPLVWCG